MALKTGATCSVRRKTALDRALLGGDQQSTGKMSRLHVATRGACDWRDRLVNPDRQWKRGFSAFETTVACKCASSDESQLPQPIHRALVNGGFDAPQLLFAVAEHKVPLCGGRAASQCDVWAVIRTSKGLLSLSVEAKASEAFGDETLKVWLEGTGEQSKANRKDRWEPVAQYLPDASADRYYPIRYPILHRCAASAMEAERLALPHAALRPARRFVGTHMQHLPLGGEAVFRLQLLKMDQRGLPRAIDRMLQWGEGMVSLSVEVSASSIPTRKPQPRGM